MPKTIRSKNSGNILVYILGAIFLMGLLIVLMKGSFQEGTSIDSDKLVLQAGEVQRYATQLEIAVNYVLRNNFSESDLRFAHPSAPGGYGLITDSPARQIFDQSGGAAQYLGPPTGVNDGTLWQFYATTHIPDVGTDGASNRPELVAVLPNVTEGFCSVINRSLGQTIDLALDTDPAANGCIHGGAVFTGTYLSGGTVNTLDDTKFSKLPPKEACIRCNGGTYHYYRVLLSR